MSKDKLGSAFARILQRNEQAQKYSQPARRQVGNYLPNQKDKDLKHWVEPTIYAKAASGFKSHILFITQQQRTIVLFWPTRLVDLFNVVPSSPKLKPSPAFNLGR